jgi:predicted nucleic acid-binding protein
VIVLDAAAAVELLLGTPAGARVLERAAAPAESLHAPHLLDVEVSSALRRLLRAGVLGARRAEEALLDWRDLVLTRYSHEPFLARIWELRENASAYDAAYIALAEALDAPLLTCDRRLAAAPGHAAVIELI